MAKKSSPDGTISKNGLFVKSGTKWLPIKGNEHLVTEDSTFRRREALANMIHPSDREILMGKVDKETEKKTFKEEWDKIASIAKPSIKEETKSIANLSKSELLKKGSKLTCIEPDIHPVNGEQSITMGRKYELSEDWSPVYPYVSVINDNNKEQTYLPKRFSIEK